MLDLLREWYNDRDFFARYFDHDPSFRDDLCFVAVDAGRLVSTLQVFRKTIRAGGELLEVGGVGNVYSVPAYRRQGVASTLLRHAIAAMERHEFDLSLLFADRLDFYERLGWQSHVRHLTVIDPGRTPPSGRFRLEPFQLERDLHAVMTVYDAQCAALAGTTVRDRRYWLGQLRYAGNPEETFLLARSGGEVVAYARSTVLYDYQVIIEHAGLPGQTAALADLICSLHGERADLPGTLAQLACSPPLEAELRARGLTVRTVEDSSSMWRVVSPARLAAKLRLPLAEAPALFARLFPPAHSVYWIADRF